MRAGRGELRFVFADQAPAPLLYRGEHARAHAGKDRRAQRRAALAEGLDDLREDLQDRAEASRQQLQEWRASAQELLDRSSRGQRRLLRAFPSLRSVDHRAALERLRRRMERK